MKTFKYLYLIAACAGSYILSINAAFGRNLDDYRDIIIKGGKPTAWDGFATTQSIIQDFTRGYIDRTGRLGSAGDDKMKAEVLSYRAHAKLSLGDLEGAMADASQSIDIALELSKLRYVLNSQLSLSYAIRGAIRTAMKDFGGAVADCDRAIEQDSKFGLAYVNRGLAKFDQGKYSAAITDFNQAMEVDPRVAKTAGIRIAEAKTQMSVAVRNEDHDRRLATIGGDNATVADLLDLFIEEHFLKESTPDEKKKATLSARNLRSGDIYQLNDCRKDIQNQEIAEADRSLNNISQRVQMTILCSAFRKKARGNNQWSEWTGKRSYITGGDDPSGFAAVSFVIEKRNGKWTSPRGAIPVPDMERLGTGVLLPIELEKPSPEDLQEGRTNPGGTTQSASSIECPTCKGTGKHSITSVAGGCYMCHGDGRLRIK